MDTGPQSEPPAMPHPSGGRDRTDSDRFDAVVVGGGFYGAVVALHLRRSRGSRVLLLEREAELLTKASYGNQARVHNGYHYPRSFLTALRSRVNLPRFLGDYAECIDGSFTKLYAIAREGSKVTAAQFEGFCERIGAPCEEAEDTHRELFDPDRIEAVFRVREPAFDAARLRVHCLSALEQAGVEVRVHTEALGVRESPSGGLALRARGADRGEFEVRTQEVFHCAYSRTNDLLAASGLPTIPLKHELAELCLVEPPTELEDLGVTVMCGPFFSCMPFPARGLHSLSHVRYTPHGQWHDTPGERYRDPDGIPGVRNPVTNYERMWRDARRYLPALEGCTYVDSLFEVKTVLPLNEVDDGRPILLKRNHGLRGFTCIMGSKIDNVYDVLEALEPRVETA